jgi:L-2-hydroxyglutarate oxidase LhgO
MDEGVVVVGGGVVGLAVAVALREADAGLPVTVLEREPVLGRHASGRNSGVLHAGFYYSPDSLKARFTREGNAALRALLEAAGKPVLPVGKVVVTRTAAELPALRELHRRGVANGVELELLPAERLADFEPLARTSGEFLWSPNTAVARPVDAVEALADRARELGAQVRLGAPASVRADGTVVLEGSGEILRPRHVVNAAGTQADRLAHAMGHNDDYLAMPFMGVYLAVPAQRLPVRRLVYPVPDPVDPFLGVHLTITADGHVKLGPTAIPVVGREQYTWRSGWSYRDAVDSAKASWRLLRGGVHDLAGLAWREAGKVVPSRLVADAAELVPSTAGVAGWRRRPPGVRAQLVHLPTGRLEMDFVVRGDATSTHVLNAVSPGWTASIPFGRHVAAQVLEAIPA